MNKELAKTLTTALVQFIDSERPEGTMDCSSAECESIEKMFEGECFDIIETFIQKKLSRLTEFEKALAELVNDVLTKEPQNPAVWIVGSGWTDKLLTLAREQFIKDGYIIEKKTFHDAVEKVDPEVMKEVSDEVDEMLEKEQKPEPVFKVGDKIKLKSEPKYPYREIVDIKNGAYYFDEAVYLPFDNQDNWEKEQKPVVTHGETYHVDTLGTQQVIAGKMPQKSAEKPSILELLREHLANTPKEQLDAEFDKLKEFTIPKSAEWSEEDQKSLNRAINICISDFGEDCQTARFLKSLPKRFNLQSMQEWSEEDEKDMAHIIRILDDCYAYGKHDLSKTDHENLVNKLKSLHSSWKPSKEQMAALRFSFEDVFDDAGDCNRYRDLKSLYEQLKKLM